MASSRLYPLPRPPHPPEHPSSTSPALFHSSCLPHHPREACALAKLDQCTGSLPGSAFGTSGITQLPALAVCHKRWHRSTLWHFGDAAGLMQAVCISPWAPLDYALRMVLIRFAQVRTHQPDSIPFPDHPARWNTLPPPAPSPFYLFQPSPCPEKPTHWLNLTSSWVAYLEPSSACLS